MVLGSYNLWACVHRVNILGALPVLIEGKSCVVALTSSGFMSSGCE